MVDCKSCSNYQFDYDAERKCAWTPNGKGCNDIKRYCNKKIDVFNLDEPIECSQYQNKIH